MSRLVTPAPPVIPLNEAPVARTRRPARRARTVRLWLPLSALWVLLAPLALLAVPLASAGMAASPRGRRALARLGGNPAAVLWHVGGLLFALSGTVVQVEARDASVHITIV